MNHYPLEYSIVALIILGGSSATGTLLLDRIANSR